MNDAVIELKNISKKYRLYKAKSDRLKEVLHPLKKKYHRDFFALKNISLSIRRGDIIGIVGKNGSGKSTLLKIISGVLTPTEGEVSVKGKIVALLELGSGFNPEFTGEENIYFYGSILGFSREEMKRKFSDIVAFSELGDFIYQPLKTYSSGMRARLGFAVSVFVDPDILILDEVLSVGDELFRRKCYAKMEEFFKGGKTILYVSHAAESVVQLCTKAILIEKGGIVMTGETKDVIALYRKILYSNGAGVEVSSNHEVKLSHQDSKSEFDSNVKAEFDKRFYLEGFKSKNLHYNKYYDVEMTDMAIVSESNTIVNVLEFGKEFTIQYKFLFNVDVKNFSTGMVIKSESGISIFGGRFPGEESWIKNISAGSVLWIKRKFLCSLMNGNYYICAGAYSSSDSEDSVLVERIDGYCFKVVRDDFGGRYKYNGLVVMEKDRVILENGRERFRDSNEKM